MSLLGNLRNLAAASRRQRPLAGRGISLEESADGTRLHVEPPREWAAPETLPYGGPFAGRITGANQITVGGATSVPDLVHFARLRLPVTVAPIVSGIAASGYVYLTCRLRNLAIEHPPLLDVTAGFSPLVLPEETFYGAGLPGEASQTSLAHVEDVTNRYRVVIGYAAWDGASHAIRAWTQHHYGHLRFPLRNRFLMYDESARRLWYLARDSGGTVTRYFQDVPADTHATVRFDAVARGLRLGGAVGHEIGAIHTAADGELTGLYQLSLPTED